MDARRLRQAAAALIAVVTLSACAAPGAGLEATPPSEAAPPVVSAEPPTATSAPAPPTTSPTEELTASPTALPYCGDDYVLANASSGTAWSGSDEEVLAALQPSAEFEPAAALEGLDVSCVASFRSLIDGAEGVAMASHALVAPDGASTHLEAWATANGYLPLPGEEELDGERHAPANPDGTTTKKMFWSALDDEQYRGTAERILSTTGVPADSVLVWHVEFTQP